MCSDIADNVSATPLDMPSCVTRPRSYPDALIARILNGWHPCRLQVFRVHGALQRQSADAGLCSLCLYCCQAIARPQTCRSTAYMFMFTGALCKDLQCRKEFIAAG